VGVCVGASQILEGLHTIITVVIIIVVIIIMSSEQIETGFHLYCAFIQSALQSVGGTVDGNGNATTIDHLMNLCI